MQLKTFKKGVHPKYNKHYTSKKNIEKIPLPEKVIVSLTQHLGAPAKLIKKRGDEVNVGELIGESAGFISANIHSPVAGKIKSITPKPLPGGKVANYVEIIVDKEKTDSFVWEEKNIDLDSLDKDSILNKIQQAGIVGMGGATFPTSVKYNPPKDKNVDIFVINGAECEPYLTCDHRLMIEKTESIIKGIEIVHHIFNFKKIYFGIEINKKDAIEKVSEVALKYSHLPIEVVALKTKYPQGGEKMLIKAVSGREVPSGKLPFEVGALVSNVGTLNAVYEAIYFDKPLIERVLTVTGDGINEPKNILAPIGTPIDYIVSYCGGIKENVEKVIMGGPMMGIALPSLDYSVMKGTSGLLFLTSDVVKVEDEHACIKCGRCVSVCPMNLLPNRLAALAKYKKWDDIKNYNLYDCMECGSCAYECPAKINIVAWIRYAKNYIKVKGL